ncbi:MAG: SAM-dependent methyltransferase [Candidatus Dojkabacteria bacterium]
MGKGKLFLIPTPINGGNMSDILLPIYVKTSSSLRYFITETPKIARSFLKDLPLKVKIQELEIYEFNEHSQKEDIKELLEPLLKGEDMGLVSDAGIPSIADPGYKVVFEAQNLGIMIVPFVGPSSIILSLMASGLNGQNFAFSGYLPKEKGLKRKRIKSLERLALQTEQTQIFMETPYRNQSMVEDILEVCEPSTYLCIAFDIMGVDEKITTKRVEEWRKESISLDKKPCLYLINKA